MLTTAINWAFRRGLRKGVAGGSTAWLVLAVAAGLVKLARRPGKGSDPLTLSLRPGDRYSVICEDPRAS